MPTGQVVVTQFQFQTGAIKRGRSGLAGATTDAKFQFQTGAIKSQIKHTSFIEVAVSIPNWCD